MAERDDDQAPRTSRKDIAKGLLGGFSVILFAAAVLALAVLWRASWYYE